MKFKCIKDQTNKFWGGTKKINGLTLGKTYVGSIGCAYNHGTYSFIDFIIIYDDHKKWSRYLRDEVRYFEPVE